MNFTEEWNAPSSQEVQEFDAPVATEPERSVRAGVGVSTLVAISIIAGSLSGAGAYVAADRLNLGGNNTNISLAQSDADLSSRPAGSIAATAAAVTPSVVSIAFSSASGAGTGSGFIIDSRGYILTNNHVVEGAVGGGSLTVDLPDGRSFDAAIVGRNSAYDLAVIKIDATNLPALQLGNSDGLVVGDTVIAIGAPLGLTGTVTTGIISALNRPVTAGGSGETSFINAVQTDAAINPGNSGGPLVNAEGRVIGVNSAIATMSSSMSGQSGSIGLGFAIPINQAKRIAEELIATGKSTNPILGVQIDMQSSVRGAVVTDVTADGPADKAGLKSGTVVSKVDDRVVLNGTELIVAIRSHKPGDKVVLTLDSGKQITVTLGSNTTDS
jgi:putative serine protease PepD